MSSQSFLKRGLGKPWQIDICNEAMPYKDDGQIHQQAGPGVSQGVIHSCRNMGEPFDSAKHRAAKAMWQEVEQHTKPRGKAATAAMTNQLRSIWEEAK